MEATMQEILDAREWRANSQKELLKQYQKPLLCFTMNIPGPEKWNRDIAAGFTVGNLLLRESLRGIVHYESKSDIAGCTAFYVVDLPAKQLKRIALEIENTDAIGRLFDMDVLDVDGSKISREELGFRPRRCLICREDARVCARSRAHGLEALREKCAELLAEAAQWLCEYIAVTAYFALNQEVNTTPKPGLVDKNNNGSHKDMGLRHFFMSANALRPFFYQMAEAGMKTREMDAKETFKRIRIIGIEAEKTMFSATGGINTHKGAIFSMGLLCAAAGRTSPAQWGGESLLNECARMAKGIVAEDFSGVNAENAKTAGEKIYAQYGITGVRGHAEAGFPAVRDVGLPIFKAAMQNSLSANHAGCITLLHLIANTDDTNLIHRSSRARQLEIRKEIKDYLNSNPYPTIESIYELDKRFIKENLSPGGSADLLAMVYFLSNLERTV